MDGFSSNLIFGFYILLTVHLDVILVNDQLDALFLNVFIYSDGVAVGPVILQRSGSGTGYIATEWQCDRLFCDGVAVGQVI
jgi:hypothetical protein